MSIKLGYSPCPNDTFIFYALAHRKIPLGELVFQEGLFDGETLNQKALRGEIHVTKASFHAYGLLRDTSAILLDRVADKETVAAIKSAIEADADNRVADIHVWIVGSRQMSAIVSIVTHFPQDPQPYKKLLSGFSSLRT